MRAVWMQVLALKIERSAKAKSFGKFWVFFDWGYSHHSNLNTSLKDSIILVMLEVSPSNEDPQPEPLIAGAGPEVVDPEDLTNEYVTMSADLLDLQRQHDHMGTRGFGTESIGRAKRILEAKRSELATLEERIEAATKRQNVGDAFESIAEAENKLGRLFDDN